MKKQTLTLFGAVLLLSILASSVVASMSYSFADQTVSANGTAEVQEVTLGTLYEYDLEHLTWTDASLNNTLCEEQYFIGYRTTTGAQTNTTASAINLTSEGNTVGTIDLSAIDEVQVVTVYRTVTLNSSETSNCSVTTMTMGYDGALASTIGGMPSMGTDLGSFLTNIAPGVGIFIIILAVFGGVGAIVYGVVLLIKKRVSK